MIRYIVLLSFHSSILLVSNGGRVLRTCTATHAHIDARGTASARTSTAHVSRRRARARRQQTTKGSTDTGRRTDTTERPVLRSTTFCSAPFFAGGVGAEAGTTADDAAALHATPGVLFPSSARVAARAAADAAMACPTVVGTADAAGTAAAAGAAGDGSAARWSCFLLKPRMSASRDGGRACRTALPSTPSARAGAGASTTVVGAAGVDVVLVCVAPPLSLLVAGIVCGGLVHGDADADTAAADSCMGDGGCGTAAGLLGGVGSTGARVFATAGDAGVGRGAPRGVALACGGGDCTDDSTEVRLTAAALLLRRTDTDGGVDAMGDMTSSDSQPSSSDLHSERHEVTPSARVECACTMTAARDARTSGSRTACGKPP